MSENSKAGPSCLHCSVYNPNYQYQEVFDELGTEIGLADLLLQYFQLDVKPNPKESQLLCEECVNSLIKFFDIDELEREQNAAIAKNKAQSVSSTSRKEISRPTPPPAKRPAPTTMTQQSHIGAKHAKASLAPAKSVKRAEKATLPRKTLMPVNNSTTLKLSHETVVTPTRIPSERLANKAKLREASRPKVGPTTVPTGTRRSPRINTLGPEQMSALICNILSEDEPAAAANVEVATTENDKINAKRIEKFDIEIAEVQEEALERELVVNEYYQDDDYTDKKPVILRIDSPSQSYDANTDEESVPVEPINLVNIKEVDEVGDLFDYLQTVVKTSFESLKFQWQTVCVHCTLSFNSFESLMAHILKHHKSFHDRYECPISGCMVEPINLKNMSMHLVLQHAPVENLPIYGSCPECKLTFSNIMNYNKHSCAHVIKKRRGARLYCEMCSIDFPSWKRFIFHQQFHLEKHRPRACFICNCVEYNLDELFHHLNYAHEPDGTLFCDICDRYFRDLLVYEEHRSSHANIGTYTCSDCGAHFDTRSRLNGHMRLMHASVICCEFCSREFATEATFNAHMKSHLTIERAVHVCSNCGLLSENKEKMQAHGENEDVECFDVEIFTEVLRDAYICEYCSSYYKTKADLRAHRDTGVHSDGVFWCQPCNKQFSQMKLYRHHLKQQQQIHADTKHSKLEICLHYMCDFENCEESYINWNSLYTHKRRTHDKNKSDLLGNEDEQVEPQFVCQFCGRECRSKMSLSVHVARSHNNNNLMCTVCNASYKDEQALKKHEEYWHQSFECPQCFKVLKNRRNYDTHVDVVHSQTKRYHCSVCQKGFYYKAEMEAHARLHSQSYNCKQCNFSTKYRNSLNVHVQVQHHKLYEFECKVCKRRFGRKQAMENHKRRVHSVKHVCQDYLLGGCTKSFVSTVHLNMHARKEHNSSILLMDDVVDIDETDATHDGTAKRSLFKIITPSDDADNDEEFVDLDEADKQDINLYDVTNDNEADDDMETE